MKSVSEHQVVLQKNAKKILLKIIAIIAILLVVILVAIPPLVMNDMVNRHVDFTIPQDFSSKTERIELKTEDGLKIVGYEVELQDPRAVVIFLSGIDGPSVTSFYGQADFLRSKQYASLLLEMRSHGESEGECIGLGYKEHLDVRAAVDYLKAQPQYQQVPIAVIGVSMGGAVAINAMGEIPEIEAGISMSAFSAWEDVFCDYMCDLGAPRALALIEKPFVKLYTMLKYGFRNAMITPKREITKLDSRAALLIHSTEDSQIPFVNFERLLEEAPATIATFVREGDYHFIVKDEDSFLNPEKDPEYARVIVNFLDQQFKLGEQ